VESGFDLGALVAEYRALRASVLSLWSRQDQDPSDAEGRVEEITRFNESLDQLLGESVTAYMERVDHSREIFLGILGHDLRSPLNAISVAATLLERDSGLSGHALKLASQIVKSASAIDRLILDVLDFASTKLGARMTVNRQPMDLKQLCTELIGEIVAAHPHRVIEFETAGDASGEWDEPRLRQLISNLLRNAFQHGAADCPVGLALQDAGPDVTLEVRNKGPAIPPDKLPLIFEPLSRRHDDLLTRPAGSIGLGLYIAREVAEAHGGSIRVRSDDTETTFTVRLPRRAPV
jgi:signal transduction histidine kinase